MKNKKKRSLNSNQIVILSSLVLTLLIGSFFAFNDSFLGVINNRDAAKAAIDTWAFEETFNGTPASPSQVLLPKNFDYVVTHRDTGGGQQSGLNAENKPFPADHNMNNCQVANPGAISGSNPIQQHTATTNHISDTTNPDKSFFICNDHMMSSMGHVDAYSVSSFFPRQEFDFSSGNGVLEWDVSIPTGARSWWEVMIVPKEQSQLGAARDWLPISETYPKDRIVLIYEGMTRKIEIGKDIPPPQGNIIDSGEWQNWSSKFPNDPANTDRRIRRKMRVTLNPNKITWSIQKSDNTFDDFIVDVPQGLPIKKGLVFFKTHAYTPEKDGNMDMYTYHWDNIRFNGPKLAPYRAYEIPGVMQLNANGDVPTGSTKTVTLDLPEVGLNPVIFGQTNQGMSGAVLLSINNNPNIQIAPHSNSSLDDSCFFGGWRTFRIPINPSYLKIGTNSFKWTVGPKPSCANGQWWWTGFSVKAFEVQFDGSSITNPPLTSAPSATQIRTNNPSVTNIPTRTNTPIPTSISKIATPTPTPTPTNIPQSSQSVRPSSNTNSIEIIARGTPLNNTYPILEIYINGIKTNQFQTTETLTRYIANIGNNTPVQRVEVRFINDDYQPAPFVDRNAFVDKIIVNGVTYQSEDSSVYSTGTWTSVDGCNPGNKSQEWLNCNGSFIYTINSSTSNKTPITIRARGEQALNEYPVFDVMINNQKVQTLLVTNTFQDYFLEFSGTVSTLQLNYINDLHRPDLNQDRNLQIDYVQIGNEMIQAESNSILSLGSWTPTTGCAAGFKQSEWLQCPGYIKFK